MKKARLPILVQDPILNRHQKIKIIEGSIPQRKFFLDGPVTDRVAVLDFDPENDELVRGVHFNKGVKIGWFEDNEGRNIRNYPDEDIYSAAFMQASTFATVLRTLDLFEEQRGIGRPLTWAFNSPQLLIIPRAGEMANAYYHRDSHSLQFFYFPSEQEAGKTIYSCLSRDIVAHETGHAIIDGIVPHLMDSSSPQSLAIHEALADMVAVLLAMNSENLTRHLLNRRDGSLKNISEFCTIAEEFGQARGCREGLRNLLNDKNLNPDDPENCVRRIEPHELSEVLSGALYNFLVNNHEELKQRHLEKTKAKDMKAPLYTAAKIALGKTIYRMVRILFRALDYLPVGCVSFADYGRAMIAVDQVAYPGNPRPREWICEEFLRRHIVEKEEDLSISWDLSAKSLGNISTIELYSFDWIAYEYVNSHRKLLGIPERIPFTVHPRLNVNKTYEKQDDKDRTVCECILKVSWEQEEPNPAYPGLPARRKVTVGTTAVFDWETGDILVILSNAKPPERSEDIGRGIFLSNEIREERLREYEQQVADRDMFIKDLVERSALRFGEQAIGPDGRLLPSVVYSVVIKDVMKLKNTLNLLHIAEVE